MPLAVLKNKVKVKICGLTNIEDAKMCTNLGANFIGFVFADSPRQVTKEKAKEIIDALSLLSNTVKKVGVFVNEEPATVESIANYCGLDILQFHGDEKPDYCSHFRNIKRRVGKPTPTRVGKFEIFKAFRLRGKEDLASISSYKVDAYLLDTFTPDKYGGTGKTFNWNLAVEVKKFGCSIVLSGGLDAKNVSEAIRKVQPEIVDVSSGVESIPGKKDSRKLKEFMEEVKDK